MHGPMYIKLWRMCYLCGLVCKIKDGRSALCFIGRPASRASLLHQKDADSLICWISSDALSYAGKALASGEEILLCIWTGPGSRPDTEAEFFRCFFQALQANTPPSLANLWHACPKWHTERFPWDATFTSVSIFFHLFCPTNFCTVWRIYIYIYIYIYRVAQKMCTLFTHQYLWNKFKWNFYFRVRV